MQLQVGDIKEGTVTGITNFGVFVELEEGKTGLVHISEVAKAYVNDINEHVKVGDTVKTRVMRVDDDGKVALSIKRADEPEKKPRPKTAARPQQQWAGFSNSAGRRGEPKSFEDMMNQFKQLSDDKFSDLKRKNPELRRQARRGAPTK